MATAKRKTKKKTAARKKRTAAKRKTTKKKSTRKKKTTKRKPTKRGPTLRKVPYTEYEFVWDEGRDTCHFGHRGGCGGEVGCGMTDSVSVFKDASGQFYILSVNYAEGYACVEILDDDESDPVVGIVFMDPGEVQSLFKKGVDKVAPKTLAAKLASHC